MLQLFRGFFSSKFGAVIALAPFEGPEVEAALARATEDRDWQVRQAAEDLLAE